MPRPRPPHLQRQLTQHGKTVWYVRIGKGPRVRVRAEFGTPEFDAEYQAALSNNPRPRRAGAAAGTLAWLIERYRETTAWTDLSLATRRNRENHFKQVIKTAGHHPIRAITQAVIITGRDRRAGTPAQARNFLDAMRGLFKWGKDAKHVAGNPTEGIDYPRRKKGVGFPVWTEEEVERYYARWPLGTKERVWIDVLLFTGLRRGDAVKLGRQHVRQGVATLRTEKSQGEMIVSIPILPILQRTLEAGPTGELAFICGMRGKPFSKESFGTAFKEACKAAGVFNRSAHGCRKIGATRAAENGASVAQLNAIFGWSGTAMASLYTQTADRKRLAQEAMAKVAPENETATSIPSPRPEERAAERKSK
ncbi:MAG: tyrosine-type recombinase/integrase [Pseudolabrys sp.]